MVFFGAPLVNLGEEEEMMTDEEKLSLFKKNLRYLPFIINNFKRNGKW